MTTQHPPVYRLEPGRCITRDGKPFVTIIRCGTMDGPFPDPCECDEFAKLCASAPRLLRENEALREACELALNHIQNKIGHGTSNHDLQCDGCAVCAALKSALAQVEGGVKP